MRPILLVGLVSLGLLAAAAGHAGALEGQARNACIADCQRANFESLGSCCRASGAVTTDAPPNMEGEGGCERSKGKQDEATEQEYARCKQESMTVRSTCVSGCFK